MRQPYVGSCDSLACMGSETGLSGSSSDACQLIIICSCMPPQNSKKEMAFG